MVQRFSTIPIPQRIIYFSVRPESILEPLLSVTDAHFRCNVISADPLVIQDTLIALFLSLSTCYCRWPPGKRIVDIRLPIRRDPLAHRHTELSQ